MISGLKIGNFKAFGPAQEIPLRPLTLVFGPNSAGKSSIIQSLLLARHIQDTGNVDAHQTTLGGAAVDLGGFARYVHRHSGNPEFCLQFTVSAAAKAGRLYCLKEFETIRIGYDLGRIPAGAQNQSFGVKVITIWLDDYEFIRLVRRENGELAADESTLLSRSLIGQAEVWRYDDDVSIFSTLRNLATRWREHGVEGIAQIAEKYGLTVDDLFDRECGKPSLRGAKIIFQTRHLAAIEADEPAEIAALLPQIARKLRDDPQSADSNEQRDKAAYMRQLLEMKFTVESLAAKNVGNLPRERDDFDIWGSDRVVDNPEYDHPLNFFTRYLREDERFKEPELSAEASAMAFRYDVECLIERASASVQAGLGSLSYLGPLRWIPPRFIPDGEQFDASWKAGGGEAWQRLRREPDLLGRVNQFLRVQLKSRYRLECQRYERVKSAEFSPACSRVSEDPPPSAPRSVPSADQTITTLSIVDTTTEPPISVSHRDVGTGISQLLPVLVNAAGAQGELIMIEQPELHLHPALQAELGDVFIESALGENKNTFLIETHSEHLILRLLRRVRETTEGKLSDPKLAIRPDQISVLFVRPGENGSEVINLPVTADGDFACQWPGGFFAERAQELF